MKNREIEGLRGWAILTVLIAHFESVRHVLFGSMNFYGASGVDVFFVISGFVITRSLLRLLPDYGPGDSITARLTRSLPAFRVFFYRRFFRIVPMALLWSFPALMLVGLFQGNPFESVYSSSLSQTLAVLTLQFNYRLLYWGNVELSHYWSLMVEEHFYLLFPWLLVLIPSTRGRIRAMYFGIVLVAVVVRSLPPWKGIPQSNAASYWHYASHTNFDFLLWGALLSFGRNPADSDFPGRPPAPGSNWPPH